MLAFACAFTMFAGAAFTDEADIQAKDAVNMLTSLGVIEGYEDGSFNPDGTVTRAEMAKMIFVVRNNTADDAAYADVTTYLTDINGHWAEGYIKFCESQGIIAGYGDGTFRPDETVTGVEAAKMLLVLAGYDESNAGLTGTSWATNTLRHAGAAGILDNVSASLSSGLPRQWAAQMIANTLDADRVRWSNDSGTFDDVLNGGIKETVGRAYMDLYSSVGVLVSIDRDTLHLTGIDAAESDPVDSVWSGNQWTYDYETDFTKVGTDYSDLMGQKVKVMFKDGRNNSVLGVYAVSDNSTFTVNQNAVDVDAGRLSIDGTRYALESDGVTVYIDGEPEDHLYTANSFKDEQSANVITFIDSDGNNRIDTAVIVTYTVAEVTYTSSNQLIAGGKTYRADEDTIDSSLVDGDWAIITHDLYNDNYDVVKAEMASGTVNATRDKGGWKQYQIGDTWYNETGDDNNRDINGNVRGGVEADYIAVNGILFYAAKTAGADSTLANVLFVSYVGTNGLNDDQAKVMFPNGDTATVTLAESNYDADQDGSFTDDNDGGAVAINNNSAAGKFFEFTRSGSNYKLIQLRTEAAEPGYYGDYTNLGDVLNGDAKNLTDSNNGVSGNVDKVGGLTIDDDADVILYADNGLSGSSFETDIKHVTGKQAKNLALVASPTGSSDDAIQASLGAFSSKVNGITRATVVAIKIDADDLGDINIGGSYAHYGYVLDDAKKIDDYTIEFPMWNGETEDPVTVRVEYTNEQNFKAGRAFGYASMTTDENGVNTLVDVDPITSGYTVDSIKEVDSADRDKVVLANAGEIDLGEYTTVLYVNSKDKTGLTDGQAQVANKVTAGSADYYAKNILIVGNKDLAIVDTIELATGVYENVALPTNVPGLTSVQYVNERTNKTDANALVGSYLTVTVQATNAGTLTLTDAVFRNGTNSTNLNAGENEFEIVITGTSFAMNVSGSASTTTGTEYESAQELAGALADGDVTITGTYPTGRTVTVPNGTTLTLDMVDINDNVAITTTGTGKVVLTDDAYVAATKTLTVTGTLEVAEDYTGSNIAGTIAASVVNYNYETNDAMVDKLMAMAAASGEVNVGNVTDALSVNASGKTLNMGAAASTVSVTNGTVNAGNVTGDVTVSGGALTAKALSGKLTLSNSVTVTVDSVAGEITDVASTTLTINTGVLDAATAFASSTINGTVTLKAQQKGSVLEGITPGSSAKLILETASDNSAAVSDVGASLKFWATAGVSTTTDGTSAVTSGVIAANTYVNGTGYYQSSTVADTSASNVWVVE